MKEKNLVFYTAQTQVVIDALERDGIYHVKKTYIDLKYGAVAPIMHQAYSWFARYFDQHVVRPDEADYPVWLFKEPHFAVVDSSQVLLKLSIPSDALIQFDNHGWERVLSMSYVGNDVEEEIAYDEKLQHQGIQGSHQVFQQPFYPVQKREIIKSWDRIFTLKNKSVVRGAVWSLKKEWICN